MMMMMAANKKNLTALTRMKTQRNGKSEKSMRKTYNILDTPIIRESMRVRVNFIARKS